jgi:hypothetical protein
VEMFVFALMNPLPTRLHTQQQQSIQAQVQVQQWSSVLIERAILTLNGKTAPSTSSDPHLRSSIKTGGRKGRIPMGVSIRLLSALSRGYASAVKGSAGGAVSIPTSCQTSVSPSIEVLVETVGCLVRYNTTMISSCLLILTYCDYIYGSYCLNNKRRSPQFSDMLILCNA